MLLAACLNGNKTFYLKLFGVDGDAICGLFEFNLDCYFAIKNKLCQVGGQVNVVVTWFDETIQSEAGFFAD
ncbi:MAG: hypothetical protein BWY75_03194 [bacterium ADurb.Bin425]|nr:MAG: hypothetical protein BWY75_03194 [bacterium ADurb.Bin425]